jgi:gamma-glutamyl-gamma-aminobutyrate hydrolase PuuD
MWRWEEPCTSTFMSFPAGWITANRRMSRVRPNMLQPIPSRFVPDGLLARWSGLEQAMVNSLHHQGVDRLAPDLMAEAHAPDGQIEAVSLRENKAFLLGVQWHPEWRFADIRSAD